MPHWTTEKQNDLAVNNPFQSHRQEARRFDDRLRVSAYDRAASMLIALLILTGVAVTGVLIVFFTTRIFAKNKAVPVTLTEIASRPGNAALGLARDLEPPGAEDAPDLNEPQLAEVLSALAENVASQAPAIDDRAFDAENESTRGTGQGDSRRLGVGAEGVEERVPRAERWRIQYQGSSIDGYARQLDYFGIELAVLGQDNNVHYAFNLSKRTPDTRVESPQGESRLYMTWRSGPLQEADVELLRRARVASQGRQILQFYPAKIEAVFLQEEKKASQGRSVNDIRRTIFGVKQDGNNYSFYVLEQRYF